jgi:cephalosporin hydroxylase
MVLFVVLIVVGLILLYLFRHQLIRLLERPVMQLFHYFYYRDSEKTWGVTKYMGVPIQKLPLDLWRNHEVLWETRPDLIIETGTNRGGSALFFAHQFELMGKGRIVTVDIFRQPEVPEHPRITYITGSSTAPEIVAEVTRHMRPNEKTMVILDSDHSQDHVRRELELYAPLVSPGCYLVVEDTNVNGHPVSRSHGPGPMEALDDFLATKAAADFKIDSELEEKYKVSFNPRGWLKRAGVS